MAAVGGLALSAGIALTVELFVLLVLLNKRVHVLSWKKFWQPALRKLLAGLIMFVVMYGLYKWWNFSLDTSTVVSIISLFVVVGGVGVVLYILISLVLGERQFF